MDRVIPEALDMLNRYRLVYQHVHVRARLKRQLYIILAILRMARYSSALQFTWKTLAVSVLLISRQLLRRLRLTTMAS